ncbi:MAG TPA: helix-turn-helix transcriptional regulator [Gammaproteobacteria bacterium]|nr:helix-turn-helix transcriptional regulator [Gammaproteobacteria bacterium]
MTREKPDMPVPLRDSGAQSSLPRLLSVRQAADYLQINEKKVYALASEGRIPGTKITGKWLFPRDLIDQWLTESSHGGVLTDRLVVAGSDDPLLNRVISRLAEVTQSHALVSYTPTGTRLGLSLLAAGRCDVAAIHWGPAEESHLRHPALIRQFAEHQQWVMVRAFLREQGLIVSARVPEKDRDVKALAARRFRWALRQEGAGSMRFLDETLSKHKLKISDLHSVVTARSEREAATTIAMGEADIAPGCHAAATEAGLEFVSTGWEAFDLVLYRQVFFRTLFQKMLDRFKDIDTQSVGVALNSYEFDDLGKLVWAAQS